jgi:cell division protein FtsN
MEEKTKTAQINKRGKGSKAPIIIGVIAAVVVCGLVATTFLLYQQVQDLRNDPNKVVTEQANQLKDKVSKIMQLPDETPVIVEIGSDDLDKLKEAQEFFKDAQPGDKVLIFSQAQKAVIYRESDNKIINSGPIIINTGNSAGNNQPTIESSEPVEAGSDVE